MIEAMEEGRDKQLAIIEQKREEEEQKAQRWYRQMVEKESDYQAQLYAERNNGKDMPLEAFDAESENMLRIIEIYNKKMIDIEAQTNQERSALDKEEEERRKNEAEQEERDRLEYLQRYGEYKEKELAITEEYAKKIEKAENEWEKKLLEKERDEKLSGLFKTDIDIADIFAEPAQMSVSELNKNLQKANALLIKMRKEGYDNLSAFKDLQEQIAKITQQLVEVEKTDWGATLNDAIAKYKQMVYLAQKEAEYTDLANEAKEAGNEELEAQYRTMSKTASKSREALQEWFKQNKLSVAINTLVSGLQTAANYAKELADVTGNSGLVDLANQLSGVADVFGSTLQGLASGDWVGAVVGGVKSLTSQIFGSYLETKKYTAQLREDMRDFAQSIEMMALTFDSSVFSDMFGKRSLESAVEAYKKANEALERYNNTVNKSFQLTESQKKSWGIRRSELYRATQRGLTELQAMQVKVRHYNGWAKMWGKSDKYQSLYDFAPELWGNDINGEFNVDAAKKLLDTSKQLTDEQRKQLQNAIDLKEAYDEANKALEDVISETVGGFASDIADAVWDSIVSGADAWKVFQEKGSEALAGLGKQMLKEFAISSYLENFKDRLKQAYGSGDMTAIGNLYTEIFKGIPTLMQSMTVAGQEWVDMLKANGYDVSGESTTATKGGYSTTMSHEDASEILGRMTDVQLQLRRIAMATEKMVSSGITEGSVDIPSTLKTINDNYNKGYYSLRVPKDEQNQTIDMQSLLQRLTNMQMIIVQQQQQIADMSDAWQKMNSDLLYDIRKSIVGIPSMQQSLEKISKNTQNL